MGRDHRFVVTLGAAAVWQVGGGITIVGPWGSYARDINEQGQVGVDRITGSSQTRAQLWSSGQSIELGTLGGATSSVESVNELGHVAGNSQNVDGERRGFLWRDGRMVDLGTLGGARTEVYDLNDRDQVVGMSTTATGEMHAFLWRDGRMIDLHAAVPGADNVVTVAKSLNERGEIVGSVERSGLARYTVKWTVPRS